MAWMEVSLKQAGPWRDNGVEPLLLWIYPGNTGKTGLGGRVGERKRVGKQVMPPPSQAFSPQLPRWAGGCGDGLDLALSSLSVCLSVFSLSVLGSVFLWSPHSLRLRETSWRAEGSGKGRSGKTLTRVPLPMLPLPRIHGTRRTSGCGTTCSQSSPACLSRAQRRASPASSTPAMPSCSSPP